MNIKLFTSEDTLEEIDANVEFAVTRVYYIVVDEEMGVTWEVTLTNIDDNGDDEDVEHELPFSHQAGNDYYYSCHWKMMKKISVLESPSPTPSPTATVTPSPTPSPTATVTPSLEAPTPTCDDCILLEYSATDSVSLPLYEIGDDGVTVDWGNGDVVDYETGDQGYITKTWNDSTPRTIRITGDLIRYGHQSHGGVVSQSQMKLTSATVSGMSSLTMIDKMFSWCHTLTTVDLSNFDTSNVEEMDYMFQTCYALTELDITNFDTSEVTDMSRMFIGCNQLTELDLSSFNTPNVTDMDRMFEGCSSLTSLDVSNFITHNMVKNYQMFDGCSSLVSIDLSNWDLSKTDHLDQMFRGCTSLTTLDLTNWNTRDIETMDETFYNCTSLTTLDLSGWCVSSVGDNWRENFATNAPFYDTESNRPKWGESCDFILLEYSETDFVVLPLMGIGPEGVTVDWGNGDVVDYETDDQGLILKDFWGAPAERTIKITGDLVDYGSTDIQDENPKIISATVSGMSSLTDVSYMFFNCSSLISLDLSNFDTSNVTTMMSMFPATPLTTLDLSNFDTSLVTDMSYMFTAISSTNVDLSSFDTSKVTNMEGMFTACESLETLDLSNFDTSLVTDMNSMFMLCESLETLDLSNFNTSNVTKILMMFWQCTGLKTLNLSNWDVSSSMLDMNMVFKDCTSLETLNLSNWNVSNIPLGITGMFWNCTSLTTLDLSDWCVNNHDEQIHTFSFAENAPFYNTESNRPKWGEPCCDPVGDICVGIGPTAGPPGIYETYTHRGTHETKSYWQHGGDAPQYVWWDDTQSRWNHGQSLGHTISYTLDATEYPWQGTFVNPQFDHVPGGILTTMTCGTCQCVDENGDLTGYFVCNEVAGS